MLPINIKDLHTGKIVTMNPEADPAKWSRAILHEFSALEVTNMRNYPDNFHYMLDALCRSVNCKPGNHFLLFDRKTQVLDQSIVYEIVSCSQERLVCKPFEGTKEIIFEGDDLHNHMMFFVKYEGKAEE